MNELTAVAKSLQGGRKQERLLEDAQLARSVANTTADQFTAPHATSAEPNRVYRGKIVSLDEAQVIQLVRDGSGEQHVKHDRSMLNTKTQELISAGKTVEIRYVNRVGIVQEWGERIAESQTAKGLAAKGFGQQSLGRR